VQKSSFIELAMIAEIIHQINNKPRYHPNNGQSRRKEDPPDNPPALLDE